MVKSGRVHEHRVHSPVPSGAPLGDILGLFLLVNRQESRFSARTGSNYRISRGPRSSTEPRVFHCPVVAGRRCGGTPHTVSKAVVRTRLWKFQNVSIGSKGATSRRVSPGKLRNSTESGAPAVRVQKVQRLIGRHVRGATLDFLPYAAPPIRRN